MKTINILILSLIQFCSFSQHEVHDYNGHPIDVEGHVRDRSDRGDRGSSADRGGGANSGDGMEKLRSDKKDAASNKVAIALGGKVFNITPTTRSELISLIKDYETLNNVGSAVTIVGLFTSLMDFLNNLPSAFINIKDPKDFVEGAADMLTLPSKWQEGTKVQLISILNGKIGVAAMMGRNSEIGMWRQLIDIIRFPEKYEKENLNIDLKLRNIQFRENNFDASSKTISVPFDGYTMKQGDLPMLKNLTFSLLNLKDVGHYIAYSDLPLKVSINPYLQFGNINYYDMMCLNRALFNMSEGNKPIYRELFKQILLKQNCNFEVWQLISKFVDNDTAYYHILGDDYHALWIAM